MLTLAVWQIVASEEEVCFQVKQYKKSADLVLQLGTAIEQILLIQESYTSELVSTLFANSCSAIRWNLDAAAIR